MKILAVSDIVMERIYSPKIRSLFPDVDLVIGCGDLPQNYLEYILTVLDKPAYYVNGNHAILENKDDPEKKNYCGSINIHRLVKHFEGYSFAGVEGCLRYKNGIYQYSQFEMWLNIIPLIPGLLLNRIRSGRYLNFLITHAPAWGIHDQPDHVHQGVKAFRWLINCFQPDYHLHGHIHVYRPDMVVQTNYGRTKVINVFGYQVIDFNGIKPNLITN